jgi:hypothetical protein
MLVNMPFLYNQKNNAKYRKVFKKHKLKGVIANGKGINAKMQPPALYYLLTAHKKIRAFQL